MKTAYHARRRPTVGASVEQLEPRLLFVTVPPGFEVTEVSSPISSATTFEIAPDGKVFILEQAGTMEVYANWTTFHPTPLRTNFFQLTPLQLTNFDERGLLGVAFDPDYLNNRYVYVYYTATQPATHNRISRFTANAAGDRALAGSEVVLLDLDNLTSAGNHNGGAMHFGPDGMLYVAVGDNANGANSQLLTTFKGKILRLNPVPGDIIPADNPASIDGIPGTTSGNFRAIWAAGVRNPFTFTFQPGTGRMFINDVGGNTSTSWEEINEGAPGRNFGWPITEGDFNQISFPEFTRPVYTYSHSVGAVVGDAIVGGSFYNPTAYTFPSEYAGQYFFADYPRGWIKRIDPISKVVGNFADGAIFPVDMRIAPDGSLLYMARFSGWLVRVHYTGSLAPYIASPPASVTVPEGDPATFTVVAGGSQPLSYVWQKNAVDIPGAPNAPVYTTAPATADDDGDIYTVRVTNAFGNITSIDATLTVTPNQLPMPEILTPLTDTHYNAGDVIQFSGAANDPEDGALDAAAFTWQIDLHHAEHTHPFYPPTSGVTSGEVQIPTIGHPEANVFYRVYLTVTDSGGLSTTVHRDVLPNTINLGLATIPAGLTVNLDGSPTATPYLALAVTGTIRTIEAPAAQLVGTDLYVFQSWSDGESESHDVTMPSGDVTYTATYAFDARPTVQPGEFLFDGVLRPGAPHRVRFAFSEDLSASLDASDLSLVNTSTGLPVPTASIAVAWEPATNTATFTFPGFADGILPDGEYEATLVAAGVTDPPGQPIGSDETVEFFVLGGDADRDRHVDLDDFNILATNFGLAPGTFADGDFTYDGVVDLSDFNILAANFGFSVTTLRATVARGAARERVMDSLAQDILA